MELSLAGCWALEFGLRERSTTEDEKVLKVSFTLRLQCGEEDGSYLPRYLELQSLGSQWLTTRNASSFTVAANGYWGDVFTKGSTIPMTQSVSIMTGMAAGATESFVVTPFELVKIRMQDKASTFKGPMDVIRQTVKTGGPLGLYVGMEATFWR